MQLGKISSDDLKLLLDIYPQLMGVELAEARQLVLENQDIIFSTRQPKLFGATSMNCQPKIIS
jgi:hypothetical protein